MHLIQYKSFIRDDHPSIAIYRPLVWQNALLSYSFMSATIPALKGFMTQFITRGVFVTPTTTGQGSSGNSYQMMSLNKSTGKDKNGAPKKAPIDASLLPGGYPESMAVVTSAPGETSRSKRRLTTASDSIRDTDSIITQDSQRIIIKKDWRISRD